MDDFLVRKLNEMDGKLDFIKTQVGAVAYITKHQNKEALRTHFWGLMKGSPAYQRIWNAAEDYMTSDALQKATLVPAASMGKTLQRMHEKELLHKVEDGKFMKYKRAEPTEGIGLDKTVKASLDAASGKALPPAVDDATG